MITGGRARKGKLMIPVSDDKYIQPIKRGVSPSELNERYVSKPALGRRPIKDFDYESFDSM